MLARIDARSCRWVTVLRWRCDSGGSARAGSRPGLRNATRRTSPRFPVVYDSIRESRRDASDPKDEDVERSRLVPLRSARSPEPGSSPRADWRTCARRIAHPHRSRPCSRSLEPASGRPQPERRPRGSACDGAPRGRLGPTAGEMRSWSYRSTWSPQRGPAERLWQGLPPVGRLETVSIVTAS